MQEFFDGLHVFHDPGHGRKNKGCSVGDMDEKDFVLALSEDVGEMLEPWGVKQLFSRRTDTELGYSERAQMAKEFGAHLSLLHHVNWNQNQDAHGLITYCWNRRPRALEVARQIMRCAPAELQRRHHEPAQPGSIHWTRGSDTVLRPYERRGLDAVLIEYGFASNPDDLSVLQDASRRPSLVLAPCAGVTRMLELHTLACQAA